MEEEHSNVETKCPNCRKKIHEVFFEDIKRRWRCMTCNSIFSEPLWEIISGKEPVRVWKKFISKTEEGI